MIELNQRIGQADGHGGARLRVYRRQPRGKQSARLLIKCGDCDESLTIHYSNDGMEINGVNASLAEWRAVLAPLLEGRDAFAGAAARRRAR